MKRLARILFNAAATLSLLLLVAGATLWVAGLNHFQHVSWSGATREAGHRPYYMIYSLDSRIGVFRFEAGERFEMRFNRPDGTSVLHQPAGRGVPSTPFDVHPGVRPVSFFHGWGFVFVNAAAPLVVGMLAILPAIWLIVAILRRDRGDRGDMTPTVQQ